MKLRKAGSEMELGIVFAEVVIRNNEMPQAHIACSCSNWSYVYRFRLKGSGNRHSYREAHCCAGAGHEFCPVKNPDRYLSRDKRKPRGSDKWNDIQKPRQRDSKAEFRERGRFKIQFAGGTS